MPFSKYHLPFDSVDLIAMHVAFEGACVELGVGKGDETKTAVIFLRR